MGSRLRFSATFFRMIGAYLNLLEENEPFSKLEIFSSGVAYSTLIEQNRGFKSLDDRILDYLSGVF